MRISQNHTLTVDVLLATYNGVRFLREQIDSVLAQENVAVHILARDDGSTDGTQELLREYEAAQPSRFSVLKDGTSSGSAKANFLRLLQASTAPYVAFCDQDDVWLPHKLRVSLDAMHALEKQHDATAPLLIYTDLRVVDEHLQPRSPSLWATNQLHHVTIPKLSKLLSEPIVTGCTALMNRPLADLMRTMPETAEMHDHWASLLAASMGAMRAVEQATLLYRQHGGNVIGAVQNERQTLAKLYDRLFGQVAVERRAAQYRADRAQAMSLLQLHGDQMSSHSQQTIQAFIALNDLPRAQRLREIMRHDLWREGTQRRITMLVDLMRS